MSQPPVNPSPDIVRLINEGYEVEIRGAFLLVSHVPYVDANKTVQYGTLVSPLKIAVDRIEPPENHLVHFIGSHPCFKDGTLIRQIAYQSGTHQLAEGLVVHHAFSNKPPGGYPDYYQKMTRYIEVISAQAKAIDPTATAMTFRVIESKPEESVFYYLDTNSARAEIGAISAKLKGRKIGIVGLGGTGSYILDLVAKTPVDEIHLFDGDEFAQHNAFRAPGAPTVEQLRTPPRKVRYFAEIYSRMRRGIHAHPEFITAANVVQLAAMDFVFVSLDDGPAKKIVIEFLEANGKSFIDVGMGVNVGDNHLLGILRTTTSTPEKRDHLRKLVSFDIGRDDAYSSNIQIAELNMLNAAFAVIKWKKLCGFYQDLNHEFNCTYSINVNLLVE
jgi:hypothetical protein